MLIRALTAALLLLGSGQVTAKDCTLVSTGAIPLPDLGSGLYLGVSGGLYPDGANAFPAAHLDAGVAIAESMQSLNSDGFPDPDGRIVLISVGMSNAAQEFSAGSTSFLSRLEGDPSLNSRLSIINCAEPSQVVEDWLDPQDAVYANCYSRLQAAGLSFRQVQAAWIKQAEPGGGCCSGAFPDHAQYQKDRLSGMVRTVKQKFPNLAIAHLSSRTRAYEDNPFALNPEPIAYETNFAVKWMIEDQINGSAGLNFDPARGPVTAPWMAWGPYLWIDGLQPRSDGLVWTCDDTANDGIHPSSSGVGKVADQLLAFFKTAPTAAPWFLKSERAFAVDIQAEIVGSNPRVVEFRAVFSGSTPVAYYWNFGDSLTSLEAGPTKTFPVPGTYTVILTVQDGAGSVAMDSIVVQVPAEAGAPEPPRNLRVTDVLVN